MTSPSPCATGTCAGGRAGDRRPEPFLVQPCRAPSPLTATRGGPLRGRVRVPGDKSISHRALIFGLLSVGETAIEGLLEGEDVLRTADACRALGAAVERLGPGRWRVRGVGVGGLLEPAGVLDFGNAGTGSRLMMGVVGGHADHRDLRRRRLAAQAADAAHPRPAGRRWASRWSSEAPGGRCPLTLRGARDPLPITYRTPVASAQIKSAVLLAGLNAPGVTTVIESEASRDHTEKMLAYFGAEVAVTPDGEHGRRIALTGRPELRPAPVVVPCDPSSAAFPMVAALIVPGLGRGAGGRDDEPAAHGPAHHAARDGRRHRRARPPPGGRRGGRRPARAHRRRSPASTCRPGARRR